MLNVKPLTSDPGARIDTRSVIISAAEECFAQFGVSKTTMSDVARAASMSRASVYRHFSDRESLIVESVVRRARAHMDDTRDRIKAWPTTEERIVEGLCHNIRRGRLDPMVGRLSSPDETTRWMNMLQSSGRTVELTHELWGPIISAEQEAGAVRADLDPLLVSEWFSELETMYIAAHSSEGEPLDSIREKLRKFVLPSLLTG